MSSLQCDFDTIGTESAIADAETAQVIFAALSAAGVPEFTITLNNRKILDGFLESQGLAGRSGPVLRALDKLNKIGRDGVLEELRKDSETAGSGLGDDQARSVLEFVRPAVAAARFCKPPRPPWAKAPPSCRGSPT